MNKIYLYIILFLVNFSIAAGENYFVRLSANGLTHRNDLLQLKFENIPTLSSVSLKKISTIQIKEAVKQNLHKDSFKKWMIISGDSLFADDLKRSGIADYVEKVGRFKVEPIEINGEAYTQYYLENIDVAGAWEITKGSGNIIIGVIDTGIDYTHPDLANTLWINTREDINGNGRLDPGDINGIDDDGNGFIDDVIGWDFTDAPNFPDNGDYITPDNDPMDEFRSGHGTQAAGIIAANDLSGNGYTGIAPQVKVMNLRAGTASGYLEEDDVASAIFYALDNGAAVINMSFGDVVLSRFLKDVIYYVYREGMIFIASSGNSGSDQVHYPSGLPEVISVGASTEDNFVAGFSNFGNTLDLVAPGNKILATAIGGGYNVVNGTSFSAPMVSAACGLLLSAAPDYSNEQIRNILKSSTIDIMNNGWDVYSASGLLSAGKALHVTEAGILNLSQPKANSYTAADTLTLIGTTVHADLKSVTIDYGIGKNPDQWIPVSSYQQRQVFNDTLGQIILKDIPDTILTIRVQMSLISGQADEIRNLLHIDRTAPVISGSGMTYLYDSTEESVLISFDTDDICRGKLYIRKKGSADTWDMLDFNYETNKQRLKLNRSLYEGAYEYFVEAENLSGLRSIDNNQNNFYTFGLNQSFEWQEFLPLSYNLPAGYMLDKAVDLDHDGKKEIVISRYSETDGFGAIEIYEFDNGAFTLVKSTDFTAIPRDAGDVDGDGLSDLLLGYGKYTFVLESQSSSTYPENIVWQDTLDFWGAGYADSDADGIQEIIGRNDSSYIILENSADNAFTETARLPNLSRGENALSFPQFKLLDSNNNGRPEIVYGDEDGDLLFYESDGDNSYYELQIIEENNPQEDNLFQVLKQPDGGDYLYKASHSSQTLDYEHEFDGRYWQIVKYGNETEVVSALDTINIFGFQSLKDYNSSIQCAGFDGQDYLFASLYPDFYIFRIEEQQAVPVWHTQTARSNAVIIDDFDGDGKDELYFNNGEKIIAYAKTLLQRPAAPYFLKTNPLDSVCVKLTWGESSGAQRYNIYRGLKKDSLQKIDSVTTASYTDSSLTNGTKYFYAVSAIDATQPVIESWKSRLDSVQMSAPPKLIEVKTANDRELILTFNEAIAFNKDFPVTIHLSAEAVNAVSAVILKERNKLLAGFDKPFSAGGSDTVQVNGIFNKNKIPIDRRYHTLLVIFPQADEEPYVTAVDIVDRFHVGIHFNCPMMRSTLLDADNYILEPSGSVLSVELTDTLNKEIFLTLDKESLTGALGQAGYLILNNLKSTDGVSLMEGNKINLYSEIDDLNDIVVYPQPLRPGQRELIFAKLPKDAEIDIFNLSGIKICSLRDAPQYGGIRWDLRDDNGSAVMSGIYFYEVRANGQKKLGKIVITR